MDRDKEEDAGGSSSNTPNSSQRGSRNRGNRRASNARNPSRERRGSASLHDLEMMEAVAATQGPTSRAILNADLPNFDHSEGTDLGSDLSEATSPPPLDGAASVAPFLARSASGGGSSTGSNHEREQRPPTHRGARRTAHPADSHQLSPAQQQQQVQRQRHSTAALLGFGMGVQQAHAHAPPNPYLSSGSRHRRRSFVDDDDSEERRGQHSVPGRGQFPSVRQSMGNIQVIGQQAFSNLLDDSQDNNDDDDEESDHNNRSTPAIPTVVPKTARPTRSKSASGLSPLARSSSMHGAAYSGTRKNFEWATSKIPSGGGKSTKRPAHRSLSSAGLAHPHRSRSPQSLTAANGNGQQQPPPVQARAIAISPMPARRPSSSGPTTTTNNNNNNNASGTSLGPTTPTRSTSSTPRVSRASRILGARVTRSSANVDLARKFLQDDLDNDDSDHDDNDERMGLMSTSNQQRKPAERFQDETLDNSESAYSEFSEYSESLHHSGSNDDEFDLEWHQKMATGTLPKPQQQNWYSLPQHRSRQHQQQHTMPYSGDLNIFDQRQDLREVDQTINLMDTSSEIYKNDAHQNRRGNNGKRRRHPAAASSFMASMNSSFVDVFLNDGGSEKIMDTFAPFRRQASKNTNARSNGGRNFDYLHRGSGSNDSKDYTKWGVCVLITVIILIVALPQGTSWLALVTGIAGNPNADNAAGANETNSTSPPVTVQDQREILRGVILQHGLTNEPDLDDAPTQDNNTSSSASPQFQALQWLAEAQPLDALLLREVADCPQNLERYALAVLYFATQGDQWHKSDQWMTHTSGAANGGTSVCSWYGVDCSVIDIHGRQGVVHLNLTRNNLQGVGTLPSEIRALDQLVLLDLSNNGLRNSLPSELGLLKHLKFLHLQDNRFQNVLPGTLGDATALQELLLSNNHLTQTIPTELNQLKQLRALLLDGNELQGTVPSLEGMRELEYLYLFDNLLSGSLPFEVFQLHRLVEMRMDKNTLSGTIPPEVESIHRLEILSLGQNQLSGELPDIFDRLQSLVELKVAENRLHGLLPKTVGKIGNLTHLWLDHNDFDGTLPDYRGLKNLKSLRVHYTKLSGTVSDGICQLKTNYSLESIMADCASDEIACACCDDCY